MEDFRENIIPHVHAVSKGERISRNGYAPKVIWFTGLSGSGKSTLASGLEQYYHEIGYQTYILDGDNIRKGLNADLDFSDSSRTENIRRISEVARLFNDAGVIVLTAFISPFEADRVSAKKIIGPEHFVEVYVECPLEVCEARDVKGLYKKARKGEISNFTGIDSAFEEPLRPDIKINTASMPYEKCLKQLVENISLEIDQ
ncbi:MAG: adenylyl-sulfate kinase [Bacteroidota bacterium]